METSAALANYTNEILSSRFSDVMWLMEQIIWKSFDKRLAEFLIQESAIENTNHLKITMKKLPITWERPEKWSPVCFATFK